MRLLIRVFPVSLQCSIKSKGKGKDEESIQSNTTLNPGHTIREYDKNTRKDLIQVIHAVDYKAASHRQDSKTNMKHKQQNKRSTAIKSLTTGKKSPLTPQIGHGHVDYIHARIQSGGRKSVPLKNHKNIGFLSRTGLDPLEITKLSSQHSFWAIIGSPAKYRLIWTLTPHINLKRNVVKSWTPLTKLSGFAHDI